MDHFDFVCDEGFSSLRILSRTPDDRRKPPVSLRAEIRCTDCVAALDVESECWQGLAKLFARNDETRGSTAWISTAGEWKLTKRGTFDDVPRFGFQQTLRLSSRYGPVGRTSRPSIIRVFDGLEVRPTIALDTTAEVFRRRRLLSRGA